MAITGTRVSRTTAQSSASFASTPIQFTTEDQDDLGAWDSGANTRLTAPSDGWYSITATLDWAANTNNTLRFATIRLDGATGIFSKSHFANASNGDIRCNVSGIYYLTAGQYIEIVALQTHASDAINVDNCFCNFVKIGDASQLGTVITQPVAQSIANITETALAFDTETFDTLGTHDNATNNTRLTAPTDGLYLITFYCVFDPNTTGIRRLTMRLGGSTTLHREIKGSAGGSGATRSNFTVCEYLTAGQYVEAVVYQSSGGNLNASARLAMTPIPLPHKGCIVTPNAQEFLDAQDDPIIWHNEIRDDSGSHDPTNDTSKEKLTARAEGWCFVGGHIEWETPGNALYLHVRENGSGFYESTGVAASTEECQAISSWIYLTEGEYIHVAAFENSGGGGAGLQSGRMTFAAIPSEGGAGSGYLGLGWIVPCVTSSGRG